MARRRHEPGPAGIGAFGISQRVLKLQRARHHPCFQRFIGAAERLDRGAFGGDIGKAHHKATVGHFLRKHRQNQIIATPHLKR